MAEANNTALVPSGELSRAIAELEERHSAGRERRRRVRLKFAIVSFLSYVSGSLFVLFHLHGPLWELAPVFGITSAPAIIFNFTMLRDKADRTELEMARNLASFNDPAIVCPLLPMLDSLDDATYGIVTEALMHVLGRCGESARWTDEERLILENAEKWLTNKSNRSDPELARIVRQALTPALPAGRPTLVRSTTPDQLSGGAACRDLAGRGR